MFTFNNLVDAEDDDSNDQNDKREDQPQASPSEPTAENRDKRDATEGDPHQRAESEQAPPPEPDPKQREGGNPHEVEQEGLDERFPLVNGPMPDRPTKMIYPFDRLAVGQGRAIGPNSKELAQRLYSAVHSYNKKHRMQFRVVKQLGGVELWRIS